jgi:hypothetical protein
MCNKIPVTERIQFYRFGENLHGQNILCSVGREEGSTLKGIDETLKKFNLDAFVIPTQGTFFVLSTYTNKCD